MLTTDQTASLLAGPIGFGSEALTDQADRAAAADRGELPAELASFLTRVREASYRLTDADVAGLRPPGTQRRSSSSSRLLLRLVPHYTGSTSGWMPCEVRVNAS